MTDTKRTGPLTETERWIIIRALQLAADQYDDDAANGKDAGMSERTIETFKEQATSARSWAELLEEAEEIIIK